IEDVERKISLGRKELQLVGGHNVDNACAAWLVAREAGVTDALILNVLRNFAGLPHRMQRVGEQCGVVFVDDSKATNVGATVASLHGLELEKSSKVVLIAGGRHKGASYAPLRQALESRGRALITIGEAAPLIEEAFAGSALPVQRAADLPEAVK